MPFGEEAGLDLSADLAEEMRKLGDEQLFEGEPARVG
jgi:hypothetical protein